MTYFYRGTFYVLKNEQVSKLFQVKPQSFTFHSFDLTILSIKIIKIEDS